VLVPPLVGITFNVIVSAVLGSVKSQVNVPVPSVSISLKVMFAVLPLPAETVTLALPAAMTLLPS